MSIRLPACILALILLVSTSPQRLCQAQSTSRDTLDIPALVDQLLDEENASEAALEAMLERLVELQDRPIHLNAASERTLLELPWLTPDLARRLVDYRESEGPIRTLEELQEATGIDLHTLHFLAPFVRFDDEAGAGEPQSEASSAHDIRVDVMQRLTRRLDLGRGFLEQEDGAHYVGSPERIYTRLRARRAGSFALNLTLNKSPGEPFRWHPSSSTFGFDHATFHLAFENLGPVERLILGDFSAEFGQGLTLWRRMSFGKSRHAVSGLRKNHRGLSPYGSTDAVSFFRGAGIQLRLSERIAASVFASRRRLDATLDTLETDEGAQVYAASLPQSGLRRTPTEIARKHLLGESAAGADVHYEADRWRLGLVGYHVRYDYPIRSRQQPYQHFHFAGQQASMFGFYGDVLLHRITLFGEVARAPSGAIGGILGSTFSIGRNAEFALLGRRYPASFDGRYGTGFGEQSSAPQNEHGLYAGLRFQPARHWTIQAFFDQFSFPWQRFSIPRPTAGHEGRLFVEHHPYTWLNGYVELRSKSRERGAEITDSAARTLQGVQHEVRQSARMHIRYRYSPRLRIRSRLAFSRYRLAGQPWEGGSLLFVDLRYQPHPMLTLDARLAFFDTESYNARMYAFENDLLYAFSLPPLFGTGQRGYLLLTVQPTSQLRLELKYAETLYRGVETFGSGLNETQGNRLRELRTQVRLRF